MQQTEAEGFLILDKPAGVTSHDCVGAIRRLYHTRKVGHTGTLDPMATGVLPILLGRAAKAAEYLVSDEKQYQAVLRLGITTDTEDSTGTILTKTASVPGEDAVQAVLPQFTGDIQQIPPMYSALKRDGKKLCDLAREGIVIEREPRPITIFSLSAKKQSETDYLLDVRCSKGTYIRTLCADIGAALGCGGVMAALRRIASGDFSIEAAHTIEEIESLSDAERLARLRPTESLFSNCRACLLPPFYERLADNGQEIALSKLHPTVTPPFSDGEFVRIIGASRGFFALGQIHTQTDENGIPRLTVKPVKKFVL